MILLCGTLYNVPDQIFTVCKFWIFHKKMDLYHQTE